MLVKKQAAGIQGIPCRTGPPYHCFILGICKSSGAYRKGFRECVILSEMGDSVWSSSSGFGTLGASWAPTGRLFFKTCEGTTVSVLWKKDTHINTLKRVSREKLKHEAWQMKRKLFPLLLYQGLPQKSTWDQWTQLTGVSTFKGLITKVEKFEFLQEFGL